MNIKSSKKRIVFLEDSPAWGGVEKWILSLAQEIKNYGYEVSIATPLNGELGKRARQSSLKVFPIKLNGKLRVFNPFSLYKFSSYLKKNDVKVLFLNGSKEFKFGGLSAYLARTEKVIYRRGSDIPIPGNFYNRFLMQNVVSVVVVNSRASKHSILQNSRKWFSEDKIKVIYNGVDLNIFNPNGAVTQIRKAFNIPDDHAIISCIGRLTGQKGYEYTLEAVSKAYKNTKGFSVLIVGKGKLETKLRKLVEQKGLDKIVFFLGFRQDIPEILRATDFLLLTPLWEGAPNVILEAMACGRPVISWKVSGIPELITDGETGYLCENKYIEGVASKIREMVEKRRSSQIKEMGENARRRAETMFSKERMVKEYLRIMS